MFEIECGSGLKFQARKWKLSDRKVLLNQKIAKQGRMLTEMLKVADLGLIDPGPYTDSVFQTGKPVPWDHVLVADIMSALIKLRACNSPTIEFHAPCENEQCSSSKPMDVTIDVREIEIAPPSQTGLEHIRSGVPFTSTIHTDEGSVPLKLRLLKGSDLSTMRKYYDQDALEGLDAQTILHIAEVQLPNGDVLERFVDIYKWYQDQSFEFNESLLEALAPHGGKVDPVVDFECPTCGHNNRVEVPFGPTFFIPRKNKPGSSMVTL